MSRLHEIDSFIEQRRDVCLWSTTRAAPPPDIERRLVLLAMIKRSGTLADFKRASELSEWLSQSCNATFASS
jgi:hypothetical protein